MDPAAIRFRFWARILALPQVWVPAVSGVCLTLSGYSTLFAIVGPLLSCAVIGFYVGLYRDTIWELAADDIRLEDRYLQQAKLRDLRRRLRDDKDYRSNQLIRDLQSAYDRMCANRLIEPSPADDSVTREIKQQTWGLFESGYQALERSYELWQSAVQMTTDEGREKLMAPRASLLDEVNESIVYLGQGLDFLQNKRLHSRTNLSLSKSGKELARGLEIAKRIHERLDDLEEEIRLPESL